MFLGDKFKMLELHLPKWTNTNLFRMETFCKHVFLKHKECSNLEINLQKIIISIHKIWGMN